MSRRKTQEQAEDEARLAGAELLTPYISNNKPGAYRCLECKYEWKAIPSNIKQKHGCPKCGDVLPKTQEQAAAEALLVDAELLTVYSNNHTKCGYRCLKCGYERLVTPNDIQQRSGCPKCAGALPKTQERAEVEAGLVGARLLGSYVDTSTKCEYECLKCWHRRWAKPNNIQQLQGCPKCFLKTQSKIFDFVKTFQSDFILEPRRILHNRQRPDMFSPELNLIVEYDGEQHFRPIRFGGRSQESATIAYQKQQEADFRFNAQCTKQGIKLIRISCYDYQKDPEATLARLKTALETHLVSL